MVEVYPMLQFTHILLFVYWLGADLGVFMASHYVARPDLQTDERARFLALLVSLDMGPRTALVLMIPTGSVMIWLAGWLPLTGIATAMIVGVSTGWLALVWFLHRRSAANTLWRTLDLSARLVVVGAMFSLGALIITGTVVSGPLWLGVKFMAYAAAVLCGLLLRGVLRTWATGFGELRDPLTLQQGNSRIVHAKRISTRYAMLLWACVLIAAFCGVVKPVL